MHTCPQFPAKSPNAKSPNTSLQSNVSWILKHCLSLGRQQRQLCGDKRLMRQLHSQYMHSFWLVNARTLCMQVTTFAKAPEPISAPKVYLSVTSLEALNLSRSSAPCNAFVCSASLLSEWTWLTLSPPKQLQTMTANKAVRYVQQPADYAAGQCNSVQTV